MVVRADAALQSQLQLLLRRGLSSILRIGGPASSAWRSSTAFSSSNGTEGRQHHRRRAVCTQEPPFDIRAVAKKGDALRLHHHQRNDVDREEGTISGGTAASVGFPAAYQRSIDGPEEFHDEVRGLKGAFQKTTTNIKRLRGGVSRKWRPAPYLGKHHAQSGAMSISSPGSSTRPRRVRGDAHRRQSPDVCHSPGDKRHTGHTRRDRSGAHQHSGHRMTRIRSSLGPCPKCSKKQWPTARARE